MSNNETKTKSLLLINEKLEQAVNKKILLDMLKLNPNQFDLKADKEKLNKHIKFLRELKQSIIES